jgi:sulfur-oxidizing protein SoxZ
VSALPAPRLRLPRAVRAGEPFEMRTLVEHPMETGLRRDGARPIPRDILASLVVTVDGAPVFEVAFHNGSAANPFHVFFLRLQRSTEVAVTVTDEAGRTARTAQRVTVA